MQIVLIVAIGVVVVLLGVLLVYFNRLVHLRNKTDNAWHRIDVELKRRYNLIPELEAVVAGYAAHERPTLEAVAKARAHAMETQTVAQQGPAEDGLTGELSKIAIISEDYPTLKANEEFAKLMDELAETEMRIAGARKYYNGAVMYYQNLRLGFPGNAVVWVFRGLFPSRDYFEIQDPADREAPRV